MTQLQVAPGNAEARALLPRIVGLSAAFLLATLLTFLVYRIAFLHFFAPATNSGDVWKILLSGMRLDTALVAIELMVVMWSFLCLRYFRLRGLAAILIALTLVHLFLAIANLLFYRERFQHLWEMLIANIARPGEIFVAIQPFVETRPVASIVGFVVLVALAILFWTLCRRVPPAKLDLWKPRQRIGWSLAVVVLLLFVGVDPVSQRVRDNWSLGWVPMPTASQFYMRFDSYQANQAVINPMHDLIRFYMPATLASSRAAGAARVDEIEAIAVAQSLLGVRSNSSRYPLLQTLPPGPRLGLKNVVVILVEGLSQSIIDRKDNGREVTPFLNGLARRGLYFSNIFQSYNATDGSVFSTVTSLHKTFVNRHWQNFLPIEVNGYFGSIAYLIGKDGYKHFAMFGFENRRADFAAFLRNQGFDTFDGPRIAAAMAGRRSKEEVGNALGLFDHVLFEEAARTLGDARSPFTALLITGTTHSPWVTPTNFFRVSTTDTLNTFSYLDSSIEKFVADLKEKLNGLDETLLVITGDHTSILFDQGRTEQLRVPLIVYSSRLEAAASQLDVDRDTIGSHVDILPTVLQLLDGVHPYSGMGVSLISKNRANARVISNSRFESLYIRGDHALRFSPSNPGTEQTRLFPFRDGEVLRSDVSAKDPALTRTIQREFFSLYELSARLVKDKRIIPMGLVDPRAAAAH